MLDYIEGDLMEVYERRVKAFGKRKADIRFIIDVLLLFRPGIIRPAEGYRNLNNYGMYKHYLLVSFRSFLRYKSSFLINLIGLTAGLTSVLFIYLWVTDELSFDKFHEKDDRLFTIMRHTPGPANILETHSSNSVLLPAALEAEMPDIEYVVPVRSMPEGIVSSGNESVKAAGRFVGKDFFNGFSYRVIDGNESNLLDEKYAIVISDQLAAKVFGSKENCVGKTIIWNVDNLGDTCLVTGVFEAPNENVSEKFDFLVAYESFLSKSRMDVSWESNPIEVCITLRPGVDTNEFTAKLNSLYRSKRNADADQMLLQRYSERYLYGHFENGVQAGGRIDYVFLFSAIGIFVLLIACINFMNLSTARASRRLKEVGVKKAIGVARRFIIAQHLTESMLTTILALCLSVILVAMLLPQFNLITGKQILLSPDWRLVTGVGIIVFVTGLILGSYPAFYLSGFKTVEVLKGKLRGSWGELWIRRGLVVFQFSISILLIAAVGVVYLQMNFVQSKSLGYNKDNAISFERQGKLVESLDAFLGEIRNIPGVMNASSGQGTVTNINSTSWGHTWEGHTDPGEIEFTGTQVNFDFIETLGIEIIEGRSFSKDFGDEQGTVIINQAAVEAMQMDDPVGKWLNLFGTKREIVGVVGDFHFQSLYDKIKPLFIVCYPTYTNTIVVKIQPHAVSETIGRIEELFHTYNPGIPFEMNFIDDEYQSLYVSEQRVAVLSKYFAIVAVVISCLGLFGMVAYAVERRAKEIGIRKVLGASEFLIARLLSGDFGTITLVSILVSLPISYIGAERWLSGFAYRVSLNWWFFAGVGLLVLTVAAITVCFQTVRAAKANPVNNLKSE